MSENRREVRPVAASPPAGGRLVGLNVSDGGVPKRSVGSARVTVDGLVRDRQRDRHHHGGLERAVCLYAMELIEALRGEGHPIGPGSIGENLTVQGLDWSSVVVGAHLAIGRDVVLQVTGYASPCAKIAGAFADGDYRRVSPLGSSRAYARVRRAGTIRIGDPVLVVPAAGVEALLAAGPGGCGPAALTRRHGE